MATLTPLFTAPPLTDPDAIRSALAPMGITFARWTVSPQATALAAQPSLSDDDKAALLADFRATLGDDPNSAAFSSADVVAIRPDLPNVDAALATFDKVHFHDDDEVRAIVGGEGVFGVMTDDGRQVLLTLGAGEFIAIPAGIWHWFYCLASKNITAIRLFKDHPSWIAHFRDPARGDSPRG